MAAGPRLQRPAAMPEKRPTQPPRPPTRRSGSQAGIGGMGAKRRFAAAAPVVATAQVDSPSSARLHRQSSTASPQHDRDIWSTAPASDSSRLGRADSPLKSRKTSARQPSADNVKAPADSLWDTAPAVVHSAAKNVAAGEVKSSAAVESQRGCNDIAAEKSMVPLMPKTTSRLPRRLGSVGPSAVPPPDTVHCNDSLETEANVNRSTGKALRTSSVEKPPPSAPAAEGGSGGPGRRSKSTESLRSAKPMNVSMSTGDLPDTPVRVTSSSSTLGRRSVSQASVCRRGDRQNSLTPATKVRPTSLWKRATRGISSAVPTNIFQRGSGVRSTRRSKTWNGALHTASHGGGAVRDYRDTIELEAEFEADFQARTALSRQSFSNISSREELARRFPEASLKALGSWVPPLQAQAVNDSAPARTSNEDSPKTSKEIPGFAVAAAASAAASTARQARLERKRLATQNLGVDGAWWRATSPAASKSSTCADSRGGSTTQSNNAVPTSSGNSAYDCGDDAGARSAPGKPPGASSSSSAAPRTQASGAVDDDDIPNIAGVGRPSREPSRTSVPPASRFTTLDDGNDQSDCFPSLEETNAGAQTPRGAADAAALLGLGSDFSATELRAAYVRAALQWHPDRPAWVNAGEEHVAKATVAFRRARAAHDLLIHVTS